MELLIAFKVLHKENSSGQICRCVQYSVYNLSNTVSLWNFSWKTTIMDGMEPIRCKICINDRMLEQINILIMNNNERNLISAKCISYEGLQDTTFQIIKEMT
jgi:hypothetical protein